jgi:hypothetical protein
MAVDEDKMNKKMDNLLDDYIDMNKEKEDDIKPMINKKPPSDGINSNGVMHSNIMTFTQIKEALDDIDSSIDNQEEDIEDTVLDEENPIPATANTDVLEDLNQIYTPVLVMQGVEGDVSDQIQEAFSEASVLLERNIIKFDDSTRMAQLISVCALLLQRKKNTPKYQAYKRAVEVVKKMKLDMQKEEYAAARDLAQKYLVKVSTTNNSSVARNAANRLLPETQH